MNPLSFCLSWGILIPPSFLKHSFSGLDSYFHSTILIYQFTASLPSKYLLRNLMIILLRIPSTNQSFFSCHFSIFPLSFNGLIMCLSGGLHRLILFAVQFCICRSVFPQILDAWGPLFLQLKFPSLLSPFKASHNAYIDLHADVSMFLRLYSLFLILMFFFLLLRLDHFK